MANKKLFIGSSSESIHIAYLIKDLILKEIPNIEPCVWKDTSWKNLQSVLKNLNEYVNEYYYAVFIGYPDDIVFERGNFHYISRDNVLFEFGYFLSILGETRTFLIMPNNMNYNDCLPLQFEKLKVDISFRPPFKILTDIGNNLITSRYNLIYSKDRFKRTNEIEIDIDKWLPSDNFEKEIESLFKNIIENEEKINNLKDNADSNIKILGESLVSEIKKIDTNSHEIAINKFLNLVDELIVLRSASSKKEITDTLVDVVELIYKVEDLMDIEQLSQKQNFVNVKKVWVFADKPIEFDIGTDENKRKLIIDTILKNLENGVEYRYITSHKFETNTIDNYLFNNIEFEKKNLLSKQIKITQIENKYFKTFFTLHFPTISAIKPHEIYMSALIPNRDDLLVKISSTHFERVFDRIHKLVGEKINNPYEVTNFVIKE